MSQELAYDALESVKLTPTSSMLWQRLSALSAALIDKERKAIVQSIAELHFEMSDAQWLRCSALAYLTRDPVYLSQQAALANDTTPPDAVMSLLGLAWHQALVRTSGHSAFVQFLWDMDIPRLQRLIAAHMSSLGPVQSDAGSARLRVAVYSPEVMNNNHGGTTLMLNTMSALAGTDVDLIGFSAKETNIPVVRSYHGGMESVTPLPVQAESLKLRSTGKVQLSFPNVDFSLRKRFDQVLQAIEAYAPDVVVFVGFMSPLMYHLYAHYPIVALSVHALPPVVPMDVWLSADLHGDGARWSGVPIPQVFPFSFRFWPAGPVTSVERTSVGLPADATLLVTAGLRLEIEISPLWGSQMLAFVEAHAEIHWLLVGVPKGQLLPALPPHPRIHQIQFQSELAQWLAMCDIYVNPPRVGGGGSIAMAMEQGLAVATFSNSDGGDKVGMYAAASYEDYFTQLHTWVTDPIVRERDGNTQKERFHARLDFSNQAAANDLMKACEQARASFQQRKEAARA